MHKATKKQTCSNTETSERLTLKLMDDFMGKAATTIGYSLLGLGLKVFHWKLFGSVSLALCIIIAITRFFFIGKVLTMFSRVFAHRIFL